MSSLYHEYLVQDREFENYQDFKQNCKLQTKKDFNFSYDIIDRYAKEFPSKRALYWINDDEQEKVFTFDDISKESSRAANWLVSKGIQKGDTVMLILRRRFEWWFLMPALHRIGAIAIPATDQLLEKDIEYRVKAANVKMIITYDNTNIQNEIEKVKFSIKNNFQHDLLLATVSNKNRDGWISFSNEYQNYSYIFDRPQGMQATHNDDTMVIFFTSGTSDYPKMVMQNFDYPIGHIITAKYWHGVVEDGLHLTLAETGWAKSTWGKLYGQWIVGTTIFVYDMASFKPTKMLDIISKYKITTFCAPPTIYRYLVLQDLSQYNLTSCKRFTTAGEPLNKEVYNKWLSQTGKKIYEGYGQTESTIICANFLDFSLIKPGSMGRPNPLYDVEILDDQNQKVATGQIGELCIRISKNHPFGLLQGYYQNDELTKKVFSGEVYHTKDNVYQDSDGYIWFVCRKDDVIKTAGFRVSPFEVESVLQQHPCVLECAVTGIKDSKRGSIVKATIVLTLEYQSKDKKELEKELFAFVKSNMALYKCPRVFEFVSELPKTISGKIQRARI